MYSFQLTVLGCVLSVLGFCSISIDALSLGCDGDGMTQPLAFDAAARLSLDGLQIETSVQTRDAGVSSSSEIWLDSVSLTLTLPLSGSLWCGAGHSSVDLRVGAAAVAAFDLDVKVDLDKWLQTLAQVVCLKQSTLADMKKVDIRKDASFSLAAQVSAMGGLQLQAEDLETMQRFAVTMLLGVSNVTRSRQQAKLLIITVEHAHDRMGLAGACLAVCKQRGVVSLQHGIDERRRMLVNVCLC